MLVPAALVAALVTAIAELPPSAYEAMQAKATEHVEITVLRVDISPGENAESQKVELTALVDKIHRSEGKLTPGEVIPIVYTITERPRGWSGPGEIPLKANGDKSVAYLNRDGDHFVPAAGVMSFSNF
ncbi:MAG: hypothetical protein SFU53_10455 [Terrimicrobiaceae bacterium]|nr:hypothetical protein [Terrimicrobiaceae bacterium]